MTPRFDLTAMRQRLTTYVPETSFSQAAGWLASTALILHTEGPGAPAHILFMQRTEYPGDRWSGQMALPGGRHEPVDPDLDATARRETREEVGVELGPPLGRLDDLIGRTESAVVATYVYEVRDRPTIVPDPVEVASTVWIPVDHLLDPTAVVDHHYLGMGPYPGVRYDGYTVWGLTLRTLANFFAVTGHRLPADA